MYLKCRYAKLQQKIAPEIEFISSSCHGVHHFLVFSVTLSSHTTSQQVPIAERKTISLECGNVDFHKQLQENCLGHQNLQAKCVVNII